MKSILALFAFFIYSPAFADGFSGGDHFVSHEVYGSVSVTCNVQGRVQNQYYSCHESILDPHETDFFTTTEGYDANSVELVSHFRNKEVRQKRNFNTSDKKSEKRFNLWIWTLLQTPLLDKGANAIAFNLLKDGAVVKSGTFNVQVDEGAELECRHGYYNSFDPNDCQGGSFICSRYFEDENYCQ